MSFGADCSAVTRRQAIAAGLAGGVGLLLRGSADAARGLTWTDQRRLGPFVCQSTFPLSDALLTDAGLDRLEQELRRVLALSVCKTPIEVVLLSDAKQHKRLIRRLHPEAPYRRALFYKEKDRSVIYAYRHAELAIDLRHECTHALLHADLPMVPLWLDEGLAEYFEPRPHERARGPSHLEGVLREVRRGRVRSLSQLEKKHDLAELTDVDYRDAWAWTHFLLHGPPIASMQLWGLLAALRRYEPPALMSQRLAAVLGSPEQALLTHFRGWPAVLRSATRNGIAKG
ncbi:MAG: hypothetical protein AAF266_06935 [Planctomycetota bacterium]